jgi:hypothetical protein
MIQQIDHIVVAVRDLARASADYERAGFTVTPGGEHTSGDTHNALVSFADGAYFELLAFKEPDRPQEHRWWAKLAKGEGTVDFALLSAGLDTEAARLRQAGVEVDGPRDGGRLRPDGQRIAWRSIMLTDADADADADGATPLPFVIEDVTAHDLRVPPGPATDHALGATRVAGLVLLVPNLERAAVAYEALLGSTGLETRPAIAGASRARRFAFGSQWIELAEPAADAAALRAHMRDRGAGPYEIVLAGEEGTGPLPRELTHAATIRVEAPTAVSDW